MTASSLREIRADGGGDCAMTSLVEARQCGRLGAREIESLERHMVACAVCSQLARDLGALRANARSDDVEPSALEHERGRSRLLRAAARVEPPSRKLRVASIAVVVLLGSIAIGASARARVPAAPPLAAHLPPLATRTITVIEAAPGARFSRDTTAGMDRVDLEDGELAISARPLRAGERFLVATSDGEAEVRGTIFHVRADHGALVEVAVDEGAVEVRRGGETARVEAGATWRRPAPLATSDAPPTPARAAAKPSSSPALRAASSPTAAARDSSSDPRAFADGVGLVARGDYEGAVRRLQAFRDANPADARSEDAAFLIVLAKKRAGHDADAAAAARRYLDEYPSGARRAEAAAIAGR